MEGFLKAVGNFFVDFIETAVVALSLFVVVYLFIFQPHQVKGDSMLPNYHDGEYLLTNKVSYRVGKPKRGDVIIFKAPKNEDYDYIKRIQDSTTSCINYTLFGGRLGTRTPDLSDVNEVPGLTGLCGPERYRTSGLSDVNRTLYH